MKKRVFGWALWALCMPAVAGTAVHNCLIEPSQVVDLRNMVEGLIETVNVRRGDKVYRGQVLAGLQSRAEKLAATEQRAMARIDTSARSSNCPCAR